MVLRFTVWQFVRLMVHLEDHKSTLSKPQVQLYDAWADVWTPLDQDLAQLAANDPDAYSDMMMDQDVVIEDAPSSQAETARTTLEAVIEAMDAEIADTDDLDLIESLKFERRELNQLVRKLGRQNQH
jgi:hypothetical protein